MLWFVPFLHCGVSVMLLCCIYVWSQNIILTRPFASCLNFPFLCHSFSCISPLPLVLSSLSLVPLFSTFLSDLAHSSHLSPSFFLFFPFVLLWLFFTFFFYIFLSSSASLLSFSASQSFISK